MLYIAHRGNLNGPIPDRENDPVYIQEALVKGYDVEVDVWYTDDGWYLGHDAPTYKIYVHFLQNPSLWIHAKNIEALAALSTNKSARVFWHQNDDVTLTSDRYIWGFRGGTPRSIVVMSDDSSPTEECYGICSDYVEKLKTVI
jgi:hypothetical protein